MSEPTPELRWAPIEPKPKNTGRIWLIVGLVIAGLAIIGALLFFLLPRGEGPGGNDSPGAAGSASPTPQLTAPAPVDPTAEVFREQVGGWLMDAPRGLDIIAETNSDDAIAVLDSLEQDARRMSDALPPSAIAQQWRDGVAAYSTRISELRAAVEANSGAAEELGSARDAVQELQSLVGL